MPGNPVRGIEPDHRHARHPHHRFEVGIDVRPVGLVHLLAAPHPERRHPPAHIVVARHDDDLAHAARIANEGASALHFTGEGALRDIAGDGDDIELRRLDDRLDCLDLLGNGGLAEMQIGNVQNPRHPSLAMTASVNSAVVALPPRSRVSTAFDRTVSTNALWMRCDSS